jgi:CheY-like chemotaxis protein
MELPSESPVLECLGQIETTSVRAADLCKQMLACSGKGRFVIRHLDLSHLVADTTDLLRLSISTKAVLKLELAPDLPAVSGDSTQIRQILMNLVINASDAIGDRHGLIRIATSVLAVDRAYLEGTAYSSDVEPGEFVCLEVSDNGCGMTPETVSRIFDPFFTTKFTGRGLGLAAVLGIVRGHRGAIKVYSEPGKGSTFKLLLPRTEGVAERDAVAPAGGAWRGSGTVLVVDDEDALRNVAARLLERNGFEVEVACNGREGVEKFAAQPDRFRAVLLDLTMPQMDGEEAFREIRRIRPAARVLLMSGFSHQEAVDRFAGKGLGGFIQKPFGPQQLSQSLRTLLETENGA